MKTSHTLSFLMSVTCFLSVNATEKPSTWQKFKNIFSAKKPDALQDEKNALKGPTFFQSIKKLYGAVETFYDFSKEHMVVLGLKVKSLKAMQEEGKKQQIEMQLKRLRADFLMSLVEYLREAKNVVQAIKIFLQERQSKNAQNFDSILQTFDKVMREGDHIVEQLLQASKAYGLKDDVKKNETIINDYFSKLIKLLSSLKNPIDIAQSIINKGMPVLKGINILAIGSATALVTLSKKLNEVLTTFQLATNLGRDIVNLLDNEAAKRVSALQNDSLEMVKDFEKSKSDIQKIRNALEKNKHEFESPSKSIDVFKAESQAGKVLDNGADESEELIFEDLRSKKN